MGNGGGQLDMPHTLAPHLRLNDFDSAFVADDTAMLHSFIFSAITLPIFGRPKNLRTKQAILFRLKRPIIDGFRFFDLTIRPRTNFLRRRDPNAHGVEGHGIAWPFKQGIDTFQGSTLLLGNWKTFAEKWQ